VGVEERLQRGERLRQSADYLRCYRKGKRRSGRLALLYFIPNELGHPRFGITASRKVGIAVRRQLVKRRLREIYRRSGTRRQLPPVDLVVHLQPPAGSASFAELRAELERLLATLGSHTAGAARADRPGRP